MLFFLAGVVIGIALGILWSRHAIQDLAENDSDQP